MYCEHCHLLTDGAVCPACGRNTRQPADNDECFLIEKEMLFGEMLIDVLKQNGVPSYHTNVLGAGIAMRIGPLMERYRIFVPYAYVDKARALTEELFSAPPVTDEEVTE